jgi:probable HAF family extracellular repeat protein
MGRPADLDGNSESSSNYLRRNAMDASRIHPMAFVALVVAAALVTPVILAADPPRFAVQVLPALGDGHTWAYALNDHAQVTGESGVDSSGGSHIFLWEPGGEIQNLDTLGYDHSMGRHINNSGQIAGEGITCPGSGACPSTVIRYTPGVGLEDLGNFGGLSGEVNDINEAGHVVGSWRYPDSYTEEHAFLYTDEGGLQDLGVFHSWLSKALDVSEDDVVVGYSWTGTDMHAFRWEAGYMEDLGTLGGEDSHSYYIAGDGRIVGWAHTEGGLHTAFVSTPEGELTPIPMPEGAAWAEAKWITQSGAVYGEWSDSAGGWGAFYYTPETSTVDLGLDGVGTAWTGVMAANGGGAVVIQGLDGTTYEGVPYYYSHETGAHDVNGLLAEPLGWTLQFISDINERGQIIAYGYNTSGGYPLSIDSVLLTPVVEGDLNCDGAVDFGDINPFVLALSSREAYEAANPNCPWLNADINVSGTVDFADINPFVALLAE